MRVVIAFLAIFGGFRILVKSTSTELRSQIVKHEKNSFPVSFQGADFNLVYFVCAGNVIPMWDDSAIFNYQIVGEAGPY